MYHIISMLARDGRRIYFWRLGIYTIKGDIDTISVAVGICAELGRAPLAEAPEYLTVDMMGKS